MDSRKGWFFNTNFPEVSQSFFSSVDFIEDEIPHEPWGEFLLLDGTNFLLLDGTLFLLLGSYVFGLLDGDEFSLLDGTLFMLLL